MFLEGLKQYGKNFHMIAAMIKTRSATQVRTHYQKLFKNSSLEFNTTSSGSNQLATAAFAARENDAATALGALMNSGHLNPQPPAASSSSSSSSSVPTTIHEHEDDGGGGDGGEESDGELDFSEVVNFTSFSRSYDHTISPRGYHFHHSESGGGGGGLGEEGGTDSFDKGMAGNKRKLDDG